MGRDLYICPIVDCLCNVANNMNVTFLVPRRSHVLCAKVKRAHLEFKGRSHSVHNPALPCVALQCTMLQVIYYGKHYRAVLL